MRVLGFSWVGVRTDQVEQTLHFFEDVMGLQAIQHKTDFHILTTPSGDALEIFGPRAELSEPEQFSRNPVVVALLVDDIEAARQTVDGAGVTLLGQIQRMPSGYAWQHFRGPDGNTWELVFDPSHPLLLNSGVGLGGLDPPSGRL